MRFPGKKTFENSPVYLAVALDTRPRPAVVSVARHDGLTILRKVLASTDKKCRAVKILKVSFVLGRPYNFSDASSWRHNVHTGLGLPVSWQVG